MNIFVGAAHLPSSDALESHVRERVEHALKHVANRVTRVQATLRDHNAGKPGPSDKHCMLEARLAGIDPVAVEHAENDFYQAVTRATEKLRHAVDNRLQRHQA